MNTFENDVTMKRELIVKGNSILGTNDTNTISCNSPLRSSSNAQFTSIGVGTMIPLISGKELIRLGANLSNNDKCGIQLGKSETNFNCGYMHFHHISDKNSNNYLSFSTHSKDDIFKMVSTGECVVSDRLTVTNGITCKTLDVNNRNVLTELDSKANLASPTFTGTVTIPTLKITSGLNMNNYKITNCTGINDLGIGAPTQSGANNLFKSFIPHVHSDGVMEIGKYIDFHDTDTSNSQDRSVRLTATNGNLNISGTVQSNGNTLATQTWVNSNYAGISHTHSSFSGLNLTNTYQVIQLQNGKIYNTDYKISGSWKWGIGYSSNANNTSGFYNDVAGNWITAYANNGSYGTEIALYSRNTTSSERSEWHIMAGWSNRPLQSQTTSSDVAEFRIEWYDDGNYKNAAYLKNLTNGHQINKTIIHNAPITEELDNYVLGKPVFASGKVYKINDKTGSYEESTVNDNKDCIPSVKTSGTYKEFLGIIVETHQANEEIEYGSVLMRCIKINSPSITFATHGDYLFYVNDSSQYNIGDTILFDGNILSDDLMITTKILNSIVGKVTSIMNEHYVSVFKD